MNFSSKIEIDMMTIFFFPTFFSLPKKALVPNVVLFGFTCTYLLPGFYRDIVLGFIQYLFLKKRH